MTISKKCISCCVLFSQHSPTPLLEEVFSGCTPSWYPPHTPSEWAKRRKHSQPVTLRPDRVKEGTWAHTNPNCDLKFTQKTQ